MCAKKDNPFCLNYDFVETVSKVTNYMNYMLKSTQNIFRKALIINNLKKKQRVCEIIVNGIT